MKLAKNKEKRIIGRKIICSFVAFSFVFTSILPPQVAAQSLPTILNLPIPGSLVAQTSGFTPALIRGITINPENPLNFTFYVSKGDENISDDQLQEESSKLIKYFLATLTTPSKDLWVNLSPYEKDKMIPQEFGVTEMGRDLLAQDYVLKQLTSSLMYPEDELGQKFWTRVHEKAFERFGTTEIPVETFNKIWIVPERAAVYEHNGSAFVLKSHLKVMLAQDYMALRPDQKVAEDNDKNEMISQLIKEILIPEIEKEVNEGETFASLRQMFNSMILAAWFKNNLKESLLGQVYVDQKKVAGVNVDDPAIKDKIYEQYLKAFKLGVYNYIKEEYDPSVQKVIPRQYFSGGAGFQNIDKAVLSETYEDLKYAKKDIIDEAMKIAEDNSMVALDVKLFEANFTNEKIINDAVAAKDTEKLSILNKMAELKREEVKNFKDALASRRENKYDKKVVRLHKLVTKAVRSNQPSIFRKKFDPIRKDFKIEHVIDYVKSNSIGAHQLKLLEEVDLLLQPSRSIEDALWKQKLRSRVEEAIRYALINMKAPLMSLNDQQVAKLREILKEEYKLEEELSKTSIIRWDLKKSDEIEDIWKKLGRQPLEYWLNKIASVDPQQWLRLKGFNGYTNSDTKFELFLNIENEYEVEQKSGTDWSTLTPKEERELLRKGRLSLRTWDDLRRAIYDNLGDITVAENVDSFEYTGNKEFVDVAMIGENHDEEYIEMRAKFLRHELKLPEIFKFNELVYKKINDETSKGEITELNETLAKIQTRVSDIFKSMLFEMGLLNYWPSTGFSVEKRKIEWDPLSYWPLDQISLIKLKEVEDLIDPAKDWNDKAENKKMINVSRLWHIKEEQKILLYYVRALIYLRQYKNMSNEIIRKYKEQYKGRFREEDKTLLKEELTKEFEKILSESIAERNEVILNLESKLNGRELNEGELNDSLLTLESRIFALRDEISKRSPTSRVMENGKDGKISNESESPSTSHDEAMTADEKQNQAGSDQATMSALTKRDEEKIKGKIKAREEKAKSSKPINFSWSGKIHENFRNDHLRILWSLPSQRTRVIFQNKFMKEEAVVEDKVRQVFRKETFKKVDKNDPDVQNYLKFSNTTSDAKNWEVEKIYISHKLYQELINKKIPMYFRVLFDENNDTHHKDNPKITVFIPQKSSSVDQSMLSQEEEARIAATAKRFSESTKRLLNKPIAESNPLELKELEKIVKIELKNRYWMVHKPEEQTDVLKEYLEEHYLWSRDRWVAKLSEIQMKLKADAAMIAAERDVDTSLDKSQAQVTDLKYLMATPLNDKTREELRSIKEKAENTLREQLFMHFIAPGNEEAPSFVQADIFLDILDLQWFINHINSLLNSADYSTNRKVISEVIVNEKTSERILLQILNRIPLNYTEDKPEQFFPLLRIRDLLTKEVQTAGHEYSDDPRFGHFKSPHFYVFTDKWSSLIDDKLKPRHSDELQLSDLLHLSFDDAANKLSQLTPKMLVELKYLLEPHVFNETTHKKITFPWDKDELEKLLILTKAYVGVKKLTGLDDIEQVKRYISQFWGKWNLDSDRDDWQKGISRKESNSISLKSKREREAMISILEGILEKLKMQDKTTVASKPVEHSKVIGGEYSGQYRRKTSASKVDESNKDFAQLADLKDLMTRPLNDKSRLELRIIKENAEAALENELKVNFSQSSSIPRVGQLESFLYILDLERLIGHVNFFLNTPDYSDNNTILSDVSINEVKGIKLFNKLLRRFPEASDENSEQFIQLTQIRNLLTQKVRLSIQVKNDFIEKGQYKFTGEWLSRIDEKLKLPHAEEELKKNSPVNVNEESNSEKDFAQLAELESLIKKLKDLNAGLNSQWINSQIAELERMMESEYVASSAILESNPSAINKIEPVKQPVEMPNLRNIDLPDDLAYFLNARLNRSGNEKSLSNEDFNEAKNILETGKDALDYWYIGDDNQRIKRFITLMYYHRAINRIEAHKELLTLDSTELKDLDVKMNKIIELWARNGKNVDVGSANMLRKPLLGIKRLMVIEPLQAENSDIDSAWNISRMKELIDVANRQNSTEPEIISRELISDEDNDALFRQTIAVMQKPQLEDLEKLVKKALDSQPSLNGQAVSYIRPTQKWLKILDEKIADQAMISKAKFENLLKKPIRHLLGTEINQLEEYEYKTGDWVNTSKEKRSELRSNNRRPPDEWYALGFVLNSPNEILLFDDGEGLLEFHPDYPTPHAQSSDIIFKSLINKLSPIELDGLKYVMQLGQNANDGDYIEAKRIIEQTKDFKNIIISGVDSLETLALQIHHGTKKEQDDNWFRALSSYNPEAWEIVLKRIEAQIRLVEMGSEAALQRLAEIFSLGGFGFEISTNQPFIYVLEGAIKYGIANLENKDVFTSDHFLTWMETSDIATDFEEKGNESKPEQKKEKKSKRELGSYTATEWVIITDILGPLNVKNTEEDKTFRTLLDQFSVEQLIEMRDIYKPAIMGITYDQELEYESYFDGLDAELKDNFTNLLQAGIDSLKNDQFINSSGSYEDSDFIKLKIVFQRIEAQIWLLQNGTLKGVKFLTRIIRENIFPMMDQPFIYILAASLSKEFEEYIQYIPKSKMEKSLNELSDGLSNLNSEQLREKRTETENDFIQEYITKEQLNMIDERINARLSAFEKSLNDLLFLYLKYIDQDLIESLKDSDPWSVSGFIENTLIILEKLSEQNYIEHPIKYVFQYIAEVALEKELHKEINQEQRIKIQELLFYVKNLNHQISGEQLSEAFKAAMDEFLVMIEKHLENNPKMANKEHLKWIHSHPFLLLIEYAMKNESQKVNDGNWSKLSELLANHQSGEGNTEDLMDTLLQQPLEIFSHQLTDLDHDELIELSDIIERNLENALENHKEWSMVEDQELKKLLRLKGRELVKNQEFEKMKRESKQIEEESPEEWFQRTKGNRAPEEWQILLDRVTAQLWVLVQIERKTETLEKLRSRVFNKFQDALYGYSMRSPEEVEAVLFMLRFALEKDNHDEDQAMMVTKAYIKDLLSKPVKTLTSIEIKTLQMYESETNDWVNASEEKKMALRKQGRRPPLEWYAINVVLTAPHIIYRYKENKSGEMVPIYLTERGEKSDEEFKKLLNELNVEELDMLIKIMELGNTNDEPTLEYALMGMFSQFTSEEQTNYRNAIVTGIDSLEVEKSQGYETWRNNPKNLLRVLRVNKPVEWNIVLRRFKAQKRLLELKKLGVLQLLIETSRAGIMIEPHQPLLYVLEAAIMHDEHDLENEEIFSEKDMIKLNEPSAEPNNPASVRKQPTAVETGKYSLEEWMTVTKILGSQNENTQEDQIFQNMLAQLTRTELTKINDVLENGLRNDKGKFSNYQEYIKKLDSEVQKDLVTVVSAGLNSLTGSEDINVSGSLQGIAIVLSRIQAQIWVHTHGESSAVKLLTKLSQEGIEYQYEPFSYVLELPLSRYLEKENRPLLELEALKSDLSGLTSLQLEQKRKSAESEDLIKRINARLIVVNHSADQILTLLLSKIDEDFKIFFTSSPNWSSSGFVEFSLAIVEKISKMPDKELMLKQEIQYLLELVIESVLEENELPDHKTLNAFNEKQKAELNKILDYLDAQSTPVDQQKLAKFLKDIFSDLDSKLNHLIEENPAIQDEKLIEWISQQPLKSFVVSILNARIQETKIKEESGEKFIGPSSERWTKILSSVKEKIDHAMISDFQDENEWEDLINFDVDPEEQPLINVEIERMLKMTLAKITHELLSLNARELAQLKNLKAEDWTVLSPHDRKLLAHRIDAQIWVHALQIKGNGVLDLEKLKKLKKKIRGELLKVENSNDHPEKIQYRWDEWLAKKYMLRLAETALEKKGIKLAPRKNSRGSNREKIFTEKEFQREQKNWKNKLYLNGWSGGDMKVNGVPVSNTKNPETPGGIDLNPELLDLQIKRDGNGIPLPMLQQPADLLKNIEGFIPVIINLTPVTNMPFLLGLVDQEGNPTEYSFQYKHLSDDPKRLHSRINS
ncbi:MAG: hypothetical protein KBD53_00355 [Candidatus Omnitrophica bacterium]|nr:hypothetical protein [Candidatus Omnitrophota bacterium]